MEVVVMLNDDYGEDYVGERVLLAAGGTVI